MIVCLKMSSIHIYTLQINLLEDKTCFKMKRFIQGEAQICDITLLTSSIMMRRAVFSINKENIFRYKHVFYDSASATDQLSLTEYQ